MDCACGRKSVFFRKYEGRHLCKVHFCESIEKKARKTIREHKMIESGDRIAVAFSGGKDSSAVLSLLHRIVAGRKDVGLFAISIDEGIAGYRPESLRIAAQACRKLGIPHRIFSFRQAFGQTLDEKLAAVRQNNPKLGEACTYCGVGRRYLLNKAARELGATKLCTGHNLDDEAQAVLMNYIRGDLFRAARMGPVTDFSLEKQPGMFIPRIKPLREIPEREVGLYALLKGLQIHHDECPNATGIRFAARDFLNDLERRYPGMKFSVLESFDRLLPYLRQLAAKEEGEVLRCRRCGEPSSHQVCKTCELWQEQG